MTAAIVMASEAKQSIYPCDAAWIASLLAMTGETMSGLRK
jgi:hypothetical protein